MSTRWTSTLLLIMCAGSLTASGVLALHLQRLSKQLDQLTMAVSTTQNASKTLKLQSISVAENCEIQPLSLQQEVAELRHAIETMASNTLISGSNTNTRIPLAEHQQEQQQQEMTQLVSSAVSSGYWSHSDAEDFRNHSISLPPQTVEEIASELIKGLENGTLQMPDDMMMPF